LHGQARPGLLRARVALLGTLCRDSSPRISPIEPYIVEGQLLIGAMAWSKKANDLRRDLRYVLHSPVTGPDSGEGNSSCTDRPLMSARTMTAPRPDRGGWPFRPARQSCSACASSRHCSLTGTPAWADDGSPAVPAKRLQPLQPSPSVRRRPAQTSLPARRHRHPTHEAPSSAPQPRTPTGLATPERQNDPSVRLDRRGRSSSPACIWRISRDGCDQWYSRCAISAPGMSEPSADSAQGNPPAARTAVLPARRGWYNDGDAQSAVRVGDAADLWHGRHIDGHRIRGPDYVSVSIIDHGDEGDFTAAIERDPSAGTRLPWLDRGCEGPPECASAAWVLVPDLDYEICWWPLWRLLTPVHLPRGHRFAVHRRCRLYGDRRRGPLDWCATGRDRAGRYGAAHRS